MKARTETITNRHFHESNYQVQRELAGRLTMLNGLIGNPGWQQSNGWDRDQIAVASQFSHQLRSERVFTALGDALRGMRGLLKRYRAWTLERQNVRELQALSDRTLRDIGITRGEIASIAAGTVSVHQVNEIRESLSRPALRMVVNNDHVVAEQRVSALNDAA